MGDETKQLIKWAAIAAAGYFVYDWLVSSGLWAQWFGTAAASNSFTTPATLLNYCQANPGGSAVYTDPATGVTSTATCAQWIASNSSTATSTPASTAASSLGTPYQQAIAAMQASAGNDSQTIDVWGYYWQNGTIFSGAPAGYGVSGSITPQQASAMQALNGNNPSAPISSEQFAAWLQQTAAGGVSGLPAMAEFSDDAYGWVN